LEKKPNKKHDKANTGNIGGPIEMVYAMFDTNIFLKVGNSPNTDEFKDQLYKMLLMSKYSCTNGTVQLQWQAATPGNLYEKWNRDNLLKPMKCFPCLYSNTFFYSKKDF